MGKRELLIALAFATLAVAAWWLTAPPPDDDSRPLSLDTVAEIWRNRNPDRAAGRASVSSSGTLAAAATLTEIRLANVFSVDVVGADRDDIAWSMTVEATGRTDELARRAADRITLQRDDMGAVLALAVQAAPGAARTGTLTLSIPARLGVRIESARRTRVIGVREVRLENLVGDVELREIDGAIEGGHRTGTLTIEDCGAVALSLVGSTATIRRSAGPIDITVRNGATTIDAPRGAVIVEGSGHDLTVRDSARQVRASLVGGTLTIVRPRGPVEIDARRSRVRLDLDAAVPATIFAAEAQTTLALGDVDAVALDIAVADGGIDATAIGRTPVVRDGRATITDDRRGVPRIAVRAERGSIVIAGLK